MRTMPSDVLERYASELRCARGGLVTHVGADVLVAFAAEVERLQAECAEHRRHVATVMQREAALQQEVERLRAECEALRGESREAMDAVRQLRAELDARGPAGRLERLGALVLRMRQGDALECAGGSEWRARRRWESVTARTPDDALRAALGEGDDDE